MNNRQRVFCAEYVKCWSAAEAARRAGYSEKTARQMGYENLTKPDIKEEIDRYLAEIQMTADEIVTRLTAQARGTMADFINTDTDALDLKNAERANKMHLVKSFKHTKGQFTDTVSIELYDAQAALVQLGRARGIFVDKIAPTDPTGQKPYEMVSPEKLEQAKRELEEWQQQQIQRLNSISAELTPPISPTGMP